MLNLYSEASKGFISCCLFNEHFITLVQLRLVSHNPDLDITDIDTFVLLPVYKLTNKYIK